MCHATWSHYSDIIVIATEKGERKEHFKKRVKR